MIFFSSLLNSLKSLKYPTVPNRSLIYLSNSYLIHDTFVSNKYLKYRCRSFIEIE